MMVDTEVDTMLKYIPHASTALWCHIYSISCTLWFTKIHLFILLLE